MPASQSTLHTSSEMTNWHCLQCSLQPVINFFTPFKGVKWITQLTTFNQEIIVCLCQRCDWFVRWDILELLRCLLPELSWKDMSSIAVIMIWVPSVLCKLLISVCFKSTLLFCKEVDVLRRTWFYILQNSHSTGCRWWLMSKLWYMFGLENKHRVML